MEQYFKCGDQIECIDVRQDTLGRFFSQLDDIQDTFPGTARFRVDGKNILFLQDEYGQRYIPYRIGYYPGKVVEVVVAGGAATLSSDSTTSVRIATGAPLLNLHGSQSTELVLATQQLSTLDQYQRRDSALVPALLHTSASITQQITQLKQQLAQSTHVQLNAQESHQAAQMAKLMELVQLLAESKARDEETQRMIRQVNDHLVIVRQKVDAVLVQNYELHEYPIPRLFVILPITESGGGGSSFSSSLPGWVPRFTEKFRLFFLCECGEHSKADSGDDGEQIDNTTHLALHEGYELARPTQYGPYLLGMLQILKTCLMATAIVAPAVGYLAQGANQLTGTVRSTAESTVHAVDFSIQFLEGRLNIAGSDAESTTLGVTDNSDFKDLQALEGADLRKLNTFLKNKDQDKILGNLYRITTKEGHVKWVCLHHYRSSYREAAMKKLLDIIILNQGQYDPRLRKVTVRLPGAIAAREFFSQLERAPAVNEIDMEFNWEFSPSDLKRMVKAIQKSNIRFCSINLNDNKDRDYNEKLLDRGRYDSLMELLLVTKIQSVYLTGMSLLGKRSSNFTKGAVCSSLTRFEYVNVIRIEDQARLVNVLQACPQLAALLLGQFGFNSTLVPELTDAIVGLRALEVLQLFNCKGKSGGAIKRFFCMFPRTLKLRVLVILLGLFDVNELQDLIRAMEPCLETLDVEMEDSVELDFVRLLPKDHGLRMGIRGGVDSKPFKRLSDLSIDMGTVPENVLQSFSGMSLTRLSLDCVKEEWAILYRVDFSSLQTLHLQKCSDVDLEPIWRSFPENGGSGQIDTLVLAPLQDLPLAVNQLSRIGLRRLWIDGENCSVEWFGSLLSSLNLFRLEVLAYKNCSEKGLFRLLQGWPDSMLTQLKVYVSSSQLPERLLPIEKDLVVADPNPFHLLRMMDAL
ncbi:hypothetical protein BG000_008093 [Podila horticola]|nr:hypothetical protein BG000_008093 [Podila horticola]